MLSSLSRIFSQSQSVPESSDARSLDKEQQREEPSTNGHTPYASYPTPSYSTYSLSRKPSSVMKERARPPLVAWRTPTDSPATSNRSWPMPPGHSTHRSNTSSVLMSADEHPSTSAATPLHGNGGMPTPITPGPRNKPSIIRMSSDSLQLQSVYLSEDTESIRSFPASSMHKPLSPIDERRQHVPSSARPSLDSVMPRTPDSVRTVDAYGHTTPGATPTHPAFINRPLNRSISQTSTSTFRTMASVNAPSIPPLDLRPNFFGALGMSQPNSPTTTGAPSTYGTALSTMTGMSGATRKQKSHLPAPSLPTVIGSPRIDVSIIYEDSISELSFVTAPSVHLSDFDSDDDEPVYERPRNPVAMASQNQVVHDPHGAWREVVSSEPGMEEDLADVPNDVESGDDDDSEYGYDYQRRYPSVAAGTYHSESQSSKSHMNLPEGYYDVDMGERDQAYTHPYPSSDHLPRRQSQPLNRDRDIEAQTYSSSQHSHTPPSSESSHEGPRSILETISRSGSDAGSDTTKVETLIQRRWLLGLSFGSYKSERRKWGDKESRECRLTPACLLFWLGFLAPWCWLIGGWCLSRSSGEYKPEGQFLSTVELAWPRHTPRKGKYKPWVAAAAEDGRITTEKMCHGGSQTRIFRGLNFWRTHKSANSVQEALPISVQDQGSMHQSVASITRPNTKRRGEGEKMMVGGVILVDPWVKRCRVAACCAGVLILGGIIVVLVVVVGVRP